MVTRSRPHRELRSPTEALHQMKSKRLHQFSLRSALLFLTLVGLILGTLPHIQAAREKAHRMKCSNTLRQHSSFHGPRCDICKRDIVAVVRGSSGHTKDVRTRLYYIEWAATAPDGDREIMDALRLASNDKVKSIRESALAALNRVSAAE